MVHEHIDTLDTLLARYAAGTLPAPARVLVDAHLEIRPETRLRLRDIEAMAGVMLEEVEPEALGDRAAMLSAVFASAPPAMAAPARRQSVFPQALYAFAGHDAADVPWRTRLPGYREYDLGEVDGCRANLFWIKPGRTIPAHTHEGCEISLILQGAFTDSRGHFGRGDISVADETIDHRPVADPGEPCIGFAVMDAPLKLTGSFAQLVRDLIG